MSIHQPTHADSGVQAWIKKHSSRPGLNASPSESMPGEDRSGKDESPAAESGVEKVTTTAADAWGSPPATVIEGG